jgi:hypothetical protein
MLLVEKSVPYELKGFRLRLVDSFKMDPKYFKEADLTSLYSYILDIEKPKDLDYQSVIEVSQDPSTSLAQAKASLDKLVQPDPFPYSLESKLTPWFSKWKRWFLDKNRFNEHELVDQPIAFFFFVMADDPDPLKTIERLRRDLPI